MAFNYTATVRFDRSNARTIPIMGKTAVTGNFITGQDITGRQSFLRSRVYLDRSNSRTVRTK